MEKTSNPVADHYDRPGLFEIICQRLQEQGLDLAHAQRSDLAAVDEFHVRGAEVSQELAETIDLQGAKVLDVGCGIGGPCRMLADVFGCEVTGLDLSPEFIRTAQRLSELVGLGGKTTFVQGDATELPFGDQTFDVVWTQHVQMNIEDKARFYAEIKRVLKSPGTLLFYDIFRKNNEPLAYPVPWAADASISFLTTAQEVESILGELGFQTVRTKDETQAGILFFEKMLARLETSGPPKLGLHLVIGEDTKTKIGNLLAGLKTGKAMLQSGVYGR